ncbi:DNA polymerase III subunit beta, partial [Eubacteriales bacterium OttesenSCG-928-N14]|nr:DNA polymerase III subunit beta [Eubacteriales bacterium OttesenSCG-928-N14]
IVVLPGRLFTEMVRKLPQGPVEIEMEEGGTQVKIASGKTKLTLAGMHHSEYPQMPPIPQGGQIEMKCSEFRQMVRTTSFAVAVDETKPILTGELIELEDNALRVVALDGYRLAMYRGEIENQVPDMRFVIPSKSVNEIARIMGDDESVVSINVGSAQAMVMVNGTRVMTRLLEGDYIKYQQILPTEYQTRVRVETSALMESVERASLMANESRNKLIKMQISEESVIITANSELGSVYEDIPVYMEGKGLEIAFNAKYLSDALKAVEDEEILMDFNTNLSPCVMHPVEGDKFLYLVLPVRIYAGM